MKTKFVRVLETYNLEDAINTTIARLEQDGNEIVDVKFRIGTHESTGMILYRYRADLAALDTWLAMAPTTPEPSWGYSLKDATQDDPKPPRKSDLTR